MGLSSYAVTVPVSSMAHAMALVALATATAGSAAAAGAPTVHTTNGTIVGMLKYGVAGFLGIPFAAPPIGALRFKAPVSHPGWTGALDTTVGGPKCVQGAGGSSPSPSPPSPPSPAHPGVIRGVRHTGTRLMNVTVGCAGRLAIARSRARPTTRRGSSARAAELHRPMLFLVVVVAAGRCLLHRDRRATSRVCTSTHSHRALLSIAHLVILCCPSCFTSTAEGLLADQPLLKALISRR